MYDTSLFFLCTKVKKMIEIKNPMQPHKVF